MKQPPESDDNLAFWLSPLVTAIPLIPFFATPASPFYLGKLMADPKHPFVWPQLGPLIAAAAIVFNATLLAYLLAAPVYLLLKRAGKLPPRSVVIGFALAGILASQLVHVTEHFRQPALHAFAASWLSPVFGCLCGLASGVFFSVLASRRIASLQRNFLYAIPAGVVTACASLLLWSAQNARH